MINHEQIVVYHTESDDQLDVVQHALTLAKSLGQETVLVDADSRCLLTRQFLKNQYENSSSLFSTVTDPGMGELGTPQLVNIADKIYLLPGNRRTCELNRLIECGEANLPRLGILNIYTARICKCIVDLARDKVVIIVKSTEPSSLNRRLLAMADKIIVPDEKSAPRKKEVVEWHQELAKCSETSHVLREYITVNKHWQFLYADDKEIGLKL